MPERLNIRQIWKQIESGSTDVFIPNGVEEIPDDAFKECKRMTSVTIPGSVKSIGDDAFYNCKGLKSVVISEGVTSIGRKAFSSCALSSVVIPDSVTYMGSEAFGNCRNLTYIALPKAIVMAWHRRKYEDDVFKNVGYHTYVDHSVGSWKEIDGELKYCYELEVVEDKKLIITFSNLNFFQRLNKAFNSEAWEEVMSELGYKNEHLHGNESFF